MKILTIVKALKLYFLKYILVYVRMATPIMIGGAKFQDLALEWTKQSSSLFITISSCIIFIWAVYAEKISPIWLWQLNTTVGRILLLFILYLIYNNLGWTPALIVTIAIALTWANRPLYTPEGFENVKITNIKDHKWFVESALNENPKRIVEDRVITQPVQEDSTKGTSRTSH